jgi:hypothetical protein
MKLFIINKPILSGSKRQPFFYALKYNASKNYKTQYGPGVVRVHPAQVSKNFRSKQSITYGKTHIATRRITTTNLYG